MTKRVSMVEAKAKLSAIIDAALHDSDRCVIERRGRAVAAIVPVADLHRLEASDSAAS